MSETISAWTWPEIRTIEAVSATLRDRIKRLNVDIKTIEENAKIYATSAEGLTKFTRDAKIAEATYTVLTNKSNHNSPPASNETFKVFEYARRLRHHRQTGLFILAFHIIFGAILGCIFAFVNSIRRDVYYTNQLFYLTLTPSFV